MLVYYPRGNRCKLLRSRMEIHAWLAVERLHGDSFRRSFNVLLLLYWKAKLLIFKDANGKSPVQLESATEVHQIGMPSEGILTGIFNLLWRSSWRTYGFMLLFNPSTRSNPTTYSATDLIFRPLLPPELAFCLPCSMSLRRCQNPKIFFAHLTNILKNLQEYIKAQKVSKSLYAGLRVRRYKNTSRLENAWKDWNALSSWETHGWRGYESWSGLEFWRLVVH